MTERNEKRKGSGTAAAVAVAIAAGAALMAHEAYKPHKAGIEYSGPWNGGQTQRVISPEEAAKNAFSADCVVVDGNTHKARKGQLSKSDDSIDAHTVSRENLDSKCFKQ